MSKFLQATNLTWSDSTATSVFQNCPVIHCDMCKTWWNTTNWFWNIYLKNLHPLKIWFSYLIYTYMYFMGPSWSHDSWIYNYLCNHFISPLKFWVRIQLMARCIRYNIIWSNLSVTCEMSVVFSEYSGFLHH